MKPSSAQLHPKSGARFVFEADADAYVVVVYVAGGSTLRTRLRFEEDGDASLEPELEPGWATDEVLKLARVLKRDPKPRLSRWRPEPSSGA